jgi:hypothetical protein
MDKIQNPNPKRCAFDKSARRVLLKYLEKYYVTQLHAFFIISER